MKLTSQPFLLSIALVVLLVGCASPGAYNSPTMNQSHASMQVPQPVMSVNYQITPPPVSSSSLVPHYHTVKPKETLWRISKIYGTPMKTIMNANQIKDETKISIGQTLFIPGYREYMAPVPLFKDTGRWKYIVIHHTATHDGTAETIHQLHKRRGWRNGLGYHFVIDNGTLGKHRGQIEVGHRWKQQMNGAHANKSNMNKIGIGVSLIGNFSETKVPPEQLQSLVYLVDTLRRQYRIPKSRVLMHKKVKGSATECPGNFFPWSEFQSKLN